jgi:hypothetical protein
MRIAVFPVVALLVLGIALSDSSRAPASTVPCSTITLRVGGNDFSYRVRVERGRIACRTARTVLRSFMATSFTARGWKCFRGHGGNTWAAACAGVTGLRRGVIIRAYLIAG